jgi:hypothetical protein
MYEHLQDKKSMIEETRDLIYKVACSKTKRTFKSKGGKAVSSFFISKEHTDVPKLIENLQHLYHDCGIGFKLLSSELGNVSYTRLRTIFQALGIEKRNGTSCVTDGLKQLRSERARKNNPWTDWTTKYPDKDKVNKHHLGGWYLNRSKSKYVWLRSSWEYGYATWLNSQKIIWDVEIRSYLLTDGRYYRPDFFLFVNDCLDYVVEIKSKWSNGSLERIDKFEQFRQEYPTIKAVLVTDELFEIIGKKQSEVLEEWKKVRVLELTK